MEKRSLKKKITGEASERKRRTEQRGETKVEKETKTTGHVSKSFRLGLEVL